MGRPYIDKTKLIKALQGAKNMSDIYQQPAVRRCLEQLEEKIKAGSFDVKEAK